MGSHYAGKGRKDPRTDAAADHDVSPATNALPTRVMALQRQIGNRAVSALLDSAQPKLMVGASNDPAEREADQLAAEAVQIIAGRTDAGIDLPDDGGRVRRSLIRRSAVGAAGGTLDAGTEADLKRARAGGASIPAPVRRDMESAFGADFSSVRVHTDDRATALNDALGARAFVSGTDVFFRGGMPSLHTNGGKELLAHELAHTLQGAPTARRSTIRRKGGRKPTAAPAAPNSGEAGGAVAAAVAGAANAPAPATDAKKKKTSEKGAARAGAWGSSKASKETFDGKNSTKSSASASGLAGVEAICKPIKEASDDEIRVAVELLARAGAFGDAKADFELKSGAVGVRGATSASGGAGASTGADLEAKVIKNGLLSAVAAAASAFAQVGVEGDLKGELGVILGPVGIDVYGKLHAFAGVLVKVKGDVEVSLTHVYAEAEAHALAGVEGRAEVGTTMKFSNSEANASVKAEGRAGAWADAEAKLMIDLTGVEAKLSAGAFAGAKADVEGKTSLQHRGRTVISAKGKVGVNAGAGGEAEAEFVFRKGRLVIGGDFTAALGWGCDVGAEIEIDFYLLARMIGDECWTLFKKKKDQINRNGPAVPRIPLIDEREKVVKHKLGYETLIGDFNRSAARLKKTNKGDVGLTMDDVQTVIDHHYDKLEEEYQFIEVDGGIKQAARDAYGKMITYIDIQCGQVRSLDGPKAQGQAENLAMNSPEYRKSVAAKKQAEKLEQKKAATDAKQREKKAKAEKKAANKKSPKK